MSKAVIFLSLGTILFLAGCATMDQGQCLAADWYDVGAKDGQNGRPQTGVSDYASDCAEYGVTVDVQSYRDGWDIGIESYCTASNGYRVGTNGMHYANSCPPNLKDKFYVAYLLGDAVATARSTVNRLGAEVEKLGDKASRNGLTDEERNRIRRDRKNKKRELDSAQFELFTAEQRARENGF